ncbi:MAG: transposase [Nitrosarchaeum sp.]|nr:transposase [Nitrosarchaeum sp.]
MNDLTKQKIKQTLKETKLKRRSQRCKVFTLKIDYSRLNAKEREQLKMFFVEAKWLYNNILASNDPFHYDYKNHTVTILNKDKQPEQRQLKFLSVKLQYCLMKSIRQNIINLSKAKKTRKVGKLKFKSEHNSIDLYRYNATHHIVGHNRIKISGIKRPLVVRGLKQIQDHYELANAKLLKRPSGYYIALTCYEFITVTNTVPKQEKEIGIDFGIKSNLTLSNGEVFNVSIGESERLKRLQQKFARQKKCSNNAYKTKLLIKKEYEKITNKKVDTANKVVHYLLISFSFIYIQDENVRGWHSDKRFSSVIQYSCMGFIKGKLKRSSRVKMISKWLPSTKQCYVCNRINVLALNDRVYKCECGLVEDRDVKAAKTIMMFGKSQLRVPMESREFKSAEKLTSSKQALVCLPS